MLKALFHSGEAIVAVHDDPGVRAMMAREAAAQAEHDRLKKEQQRLIDYLFEGPNTPAPTDEEREEANRRLAADLGVSNPRYFYLPEYRTAERALKAAKAERQQIVAQTRTRLNEARRAARQELVAAVFDALQAAVEAQERLKEFDDETCRLGGSVVALPCPGLSRAWHDNYRREAERRSWL